jgi:hypothetical protein
MKQRLLPPLLESVSALKVQSGFFGTFDEPRLALCVTA